MIQNIYIYVYLVGTFLFSPIVGMMIQSDELIFFRGVAQPPTRYMAMDQYLYIPFLGE